MVAHMYDEHVLMSLVAKRYRHLADNLGRQLERTVGISPVSFDDLIHIADAVEPGSLPERVQTHGLTVNGSSDSKAGMETPALSRCRDQPILQPQRDSNPCRHLERVVS